MAFKVYKIRKSRLQDNFFNITHFSCADKNVYDTKSRLHILYI